MSCLPVRSIAISRNGSSAVSNLGTISWAETPGATLVSLISVTSRSILFIEPIDKARTIQLLEKPGIGEIFGIRRFCRRDFFAQLIQYDSKSLQCRVGFDGDKLSQQLIGLFQFSPDQ